MARTREIADSTIIAALADNDGKVYRAAAAIGCSAKTIYNRCKLNPELAEIIDGAKGYHLDIAEMKLKEAVDAGEAWAVCFFLKTQGKHRGYTERHEVEQASKITVTLPDALRKLREASIAVVSSSQLHS